MIHTWSVLCKKASIDSITNVVSLFEVIEKLTITQNHGVSIPVDASLESFVMPLDFEVVTLISNITKKDRKPFIKIELLNSQNEKMGEIENQMEVTPKEATSLRSRVLFNTIQIKGEGVYMFKVSLKATKEEKFEEVARIPLEVKIIRQTAK